LRRSRKRKRKGNKEFHGERMFKVRSKNLIEESESHIVIFLFLWLLLLLSRSSFSRSSSASSGSGSSGSGSRANSSPHSGDQGLQVAGLEGLGEESWPVWLDINTSSLEDGSQLLWGDGDVIISKDESSIDTGEFRRHFGDYAQVSWEDLAQREQGNLL